MAHKPSEDASELPNGTQDDAEEETAQNGTAEPVTEAVKVPSEIEQEAEEKVYIGL